MDKIKCHHESCNTIMQISEFSSVFFCRSLPQSSLQTQNHYKVQVKPTFYIISLNILYKYYYDLHSINDVFLANGILNYMYSVIKRASMRRTFTLLIIRKQYYVSIEPQKA